jgi:hypothetical protein
MLDRHNSGEAPIPLFGAKYQFHLEGVVDCPEFLVRDLTGFSGFAGCAKITL